MTQHKKHSLVTGGLLYLILNKISFLPNNEDNPYRKSLFFVAFCGLPLIALSLFDHTFYNNNLHLPFIEDPIPLTRIFFVIPFLIIAEQFIDPIYQQFIQKTEQLLAEESKENFTGIVNRIASLQKTILPELALFTLAFLYFFFAKEQVLPKNSWYVDETNDSLSLAGIWYFAACVPLYQFLFTRWIWRWLLIGYAYFKFSKLKLNFTAAHSDEMGGASYLHLLPFSFCFLAFSMSTTLAAQLVDDVLLAPVSKFQITSTLLLYDLGLLVLFFTPLLFFIVPLAKTKLKAIFRFGSLVNDHNLYFEDKWLNEGKTDTKQILGSMDASSQADLNGAFEYVIKMKSLPVTLQHFVYFVIIVNLPFVGLLFIQYSTSELFISLINKLLE